MSIFRQLTDKPWETAQATVDDRHDGSEFSLPAATVVVRLLLAVITVLFSLLVVAYGDRLTVADWRPLAEPWLLWLNTVFLILSSVALQWACVGASRHQIDAMKAGLVGGGVFAFAFLAGQLLAWQQLVDLGYFAKTNPAYGFFYLITGLHGVHLLGGLVAWGRTSAKVWSGFQVTRVRLSVELCAVYWHFLLVVWLVLFSLLLLT